MGCGCPVRSNHMVDEDFMGFPWSSRPTERMGEVKTAVRTTCRARFYCVSVTMRFLAFPYMIVRNKLNDVLILTLPANAGSRSCCANFNVRRVRICLISCRPISLHTWATCTNTSKLFLQNKLIRGLGDVVFAVLMGSTNWGIDSVRRRRYGEYLFILLKTTTQ